MTSIAATASVTNATLISTDLDFSHLHQTYLDFWQIAVR